MLPSFTDRVAERSTTWGEREVKILQTILKHYNLPQNKSKRSKQKQKIKAKAKYQNKSKTSKHKGTQVAGAWTERQKMFHGGSFLKLAIGNMDI